jgi:hypothetical protein
MSRPKLDVDWNDVFLHVKTLVINGLTIRKALNRMAIKQRTFYKYITAEQKLILKSHWVGSKKTTKHKKGEPTRINPDNVFIRL